MNHLEAYWPFKIITNYHVNSEFKGNLLKGQNNHSASWLTNVNACLKFSSVSAVLTYFLCSSDYPQDMATTVTLLSMGEMETRQGE